MNVREFLISDMQAEKDGYIAMIRNNEMTEDEKKVLNAKIDALDARISQAKQLDDSASSELEKTVKTLNAKFDAVREKLNDKNIKIEGVADGNYLDSQNAVHDFAECLRHCSKSNPVSKLWKEQLVKNAVSFSNEETEYSFFPTPVAQFIADTWETKAGEILREFNFIGAKRFPVRVNTTGQYDADARAKGHTKGSKKSVQAINLDSFWIDSQFVYKIQTVYNDMEFASDGELIKYVINELFVQWYTEVLRAILVGDGRPDSDMDKIKAVVPIYQTVSSQYGDITARHGAGFVNIYNIPQAAGETTLEYMMDHVIAPIEDGSNDILLFVTKEDYQAMRKFTAGTGATPTYMNEAQLADAIGVKRIVVVPYLNSTTVNDARAIAVHAEKYGVIGSLTPDLTSWEEPWDNERAYRVEMLVGGDAIGYNMASVAVNA